MSKTDSDIPPGEEKNSKQSDTAVSGEQNKPAEETSQQKTGGRLDAINTEFMYYTATLRNLAPTLTNESDKQLVIQWVKKLFRPEYHSSMLREKRNRYLLYLMITILNDELFGIFRTNPPIGALPDFKDFQVPFSLSRWEVDQTWNEITESLPKDFIPMDCSIHKSQDECEADQDLNEILDKEFQFMLYMAYPYCALLKGAAQRTRAASWLQTLCVIHLGAACSSMRAVRNDYIMALLGYAINLRVSGPFAEHPPSNVLVPLGEAARLCMANGAPGGGDILDPTGPAANEFLAGQPVPEEGAFCYVAITGELLTSLTSGPS